MTRINAGIPVRCLTDEHLLAEHREIKRLPWCLENAIESGSIKNIPEKFTLGKGHVLFFLDKMGYVLARYFQINSELRNRGFHIQFFGNNWFGIDNKYNQECHVTDKCVNMLMERISQRIRESKKEVWHYYGKPISKDQAIKILIDKYQEARNEAYIERICPTLKIYVKGEVIKK